MLGINVTDIDPKILSKVGESIEKIVPDSQIHPILYGSAPQLFHQIKMFETNIQRHEKARSDVGIFLNLSMQVADT